MSDMGSKDRARHPGQPIVAFDFDGTLTIRDSFTDFLRWRAGPGAWALGLVKMAPAVATYARDRDRGRIKAASVREFLKGVTRRSWPPTPNDSLNRLGAGSCGPTPWPAGTTGA